MSKYSVCWTDTAIELLRGISDKRMARKLVESSRRLTDDPDKQGSPLYGELEGFWRYRFSRYRVIYVIEEDRQAISIVATGIRAKGKPKDIYAVARKLLRAGLLEPDQ